MCYTAYSQLNNFQTKSIEIFIYDKESLVMTEKRPTAAFVISLLAGIFILLGGGMMSMMSSLIGSYGGYGGYGGMMGGYGGYGGFGGMMNGYNGFGYGMMRSLGFGFGLMGILGLVFGIIVIVSALMLNNRPKEHKTWGILILVFSVLSVFGSIMGGFGIGLLLGIVGGILAITWKP